MSLYKRIPLEEDGSKCKINNDILLLDKVVE